MEFLNQQGLERLLINLNQYINGLNISNAQSIEYSELVTLKSNSNLIPGNLYRITDYITTTTVTGTQSAGHQFDIIVLALTENILAEEAWACQHDGDAYFNNSNLNAWKIWYCLDNDTTKFNWISKTDGKGVIYRMIDEWGNDCPYDFKNIQFKRYNIKLENVIYNSIDSYGFQKFYELIMPETNTLIASHVHNYITVGDNNLLINYQGYTGIDTSAKYISFDMNEPTKPNTAIVKVSDDDVCWCYTFSVFSALWGVISDFSLTGRANNNIIMDNNRNTKMHQLNYNNIFIALNRGGIQLNTTKPINGNILYPGCINNTIGDGSICNILYYGCVSNLLIHSSNYNKLGADSKYNIIYGSHNEFGESCSINMTNADPKSSTNTSLRINNYSKLGNYCEFNTVNDGAVFGNQCKNNQIVASSKNIVFGEYINNVKLINNDTINSTSEVLQNITVNNHLSNANVTIPITSQDYSIKIGKDSNGNVKYYNEVDLIN